MMYYVVYVDLMGENKREAFASREEAIRFYKSNLRNMAYGYISDEEAIEVAEEVKDEYEEMLAERQAEMLATLMGRALPY